MCPAASRSSQSAFIHPFNHPRAHARITQYYGVFPLKGKPLNVRDAKHAQIIKNQEIQNVCKILGLKFGTVCVKALRGWDVRITDSVDRTHLRQVRGHKVASVRSSDDHD